ncbi:hypothetical protein QE369_000674 [Agrobacterium larrymoorei]|uniref:Type VI secretion protein n=1 Tax=Agrobacterium larrymoorei TaxID=160699 RepID=A0AAJ2EPX6_9HYPH|nr:hypothetical protein [Agrobacterium larrymoorei]MDR6100496.1 hypothetical protein [Agrobacterium larrymoorei]
MSRNLLSLCVIITFFSIPATKGFAQVPVNDAKRTVSETNTAVCMRRARTFKQSTVAPTRDIRASMTGDNDAGGMQAMTGENVLGAVPSSSTISGSDFAVLMAIANTVQAIKAKNAGQAISALASVAAAVAANSSSLSTQTATVGQANTLKGAFEQNGIARLSNAQIWNQAIQAVSTTVQLRNQRLLDMTAAASATAKAGAYDPSKTTLTEPTKQEGQ